MVIQLPHTAIRLDEHPSAPSAPFSRVSVTQATLLPKARARQAC